MLVDTSAAVALVVADHANHDDVSEAVGDRPLGLAGHAAFETYSVLTRLPGPTRRTPTVVAELLQASFPIECQLSAPASKRLFALLAELGVSGGAVYDALVGAAAKEHGLPLVTRDRRALDTYRALEVETVVLQ